MVRRPLFDVTITVEGDDDTGAGIYGVIVVDRYKNKLGTIVDTKSDMSSLDQAMTFAKTAVSAFLKDTRA